MVVELEAGLRSLFVRWLHVLD